MDLCVNDASSYHFYYIHPKQGRYVEFSYELLPAIANIVDTDIFVCN